MVKQVDFSDIIYQLRRAEEHLTDLRAEVDDIVESNHDLRIDDSDRQRDHPNVIVNYPIVMSGEIEATEQAPQSIKGRVGDFAISLRSALNYMTVLLAKHDSMSNMVGKLVQFPMEDRSDTFTNHRKTFLKGISYEYVAFFQRYQPYNGCDWMKRLRDLSNTSKHLNLVVVKTEYIRSHGTAWVEFEAEATNAGDEVDVEEVAAEVSFPDGTPVVDTLENIHVQVAEVFKAFTAFFI
jgi:hypothetical protein